MRAAFDRAAQGQLRVDKLALRYQNNGQVIDVTGWHADDTPFAFVSAPFRTDPNSRAGEIAHDLIRAHTGAPPPQSPTVPPAVTAVIKKATSAMPTPQPITGLAALLKQNLAAANARAQKLASDFPNDVATLNARLDEAEKVQTDIRQASADIHDALGGGNGGPPLSDTPPSSQAG